MSKSYEKVNYLLRLKKQIERKLIIETLQHLGTIIDIKSYRYFGFGSIYFADFILFHKYLNIGKMTSIDNKQDDEKRFNFNKPFHFIDFRIYECKAFLEKKLDWNEKLLFWLDYDVDIDELIIDNVEFIASKAKPFDIFLITIDAEPPPVEPEEFIVQFRDYIPIELANNKTVRGNFPEILNGIMNACIQNGLITQTDIRFLQIFNLVYEDTHKMYTFGGIFCNNDNFDTLIKQLSPLPYIRHGGSVVEINCPLLTPREKMYLDSFIKKMGDIDNKCMEITGLKKEEVETYSQYYKYYPQFFESIY